MKWSRCVFITLFIVSFMGIGPACADDAAKKKVLVDAVQYAVDLLEKEGRPAFAELKAFRFDNGNGYIYLTDMNLVVIMHPVAPELLNKDCTLIKDTKGKYFGAEFKAKAEKSGEGWTHYWWPNPAKSKQPELKCSYYKVAKMKNGEKVIAYAADFGISEQGCK